MPLVYSTAVMALIELARVRSGEVINLIISSVEHR